jgi:hypothetical protein
MIGYSQITSVPIWFWECMYKEDKFLVRGAPVSDNNEWPNEMVQNSNDLWAFLEVRSF